MKVFLRFFFITIVLFFWSYCFANSYTFTDRKGRQLNGELVSGNSEVVTIRRSSDQKLFKLNRSLFILENQAYFDAWLALKTSKSYRLREGESIRALSRQLRIDLIWERGDFEAFEVQRRSDKSSKWITLNNPTPNFHLFSDYLGKANIRYFYRVRGIRKKNGLGKRNGNWMPIVEGTTLPYDQKGFITELQEACTRYFIEEAHPYSGLSLEGSPGWSGQVAIGASGMGMANIIVAVHRGFISKEEGLFLALRMLRFLDEKAEKHAGLFGHWMNGETGKILNFGKELDAADAVETSFLMQGIILLREFFDGESSDEKKLRKIATQLCENAQWSKFLMKKKEGSYLMWHWHPSRGFGRLPIHGFHEAMMPYVLGIASDTYPIPSKSFNTGWIHPERGLGYKQEHFGIEHSLGSGIGWPLFFAHYSHIGFDPKRIFYHGKSYFEHFVDATKIHQCYAQSRAHDFIGYDKLWGQAASLSPNGYRANRPGNRDEGTIATTASLSSMPYLPDAVIECMNSMYLDYGSELWGPYGFYNAINPTKNWVGQRYIGIELGPIAPMIENHRSGLLWNLFMQSPEAKRALARIDE